MCGRFTLTVDPEELMERFHLDTADAMPQPRYNIAPTQNVSVVLNESPSRLALLQWGLIPSWAKDPSIGAQMINARAETISEKPAFRNAYKKRRCLVLADGFYEWRKVKEGSKTVKAPQRILLKSGKPFAMAGLWENWVSPQGENIRTCTIITTEANELVTPLHNRMPVILAPESESIWLADSADTATVTNLLKPFTSELLTYYPVSRRVNATANDEPSLIQPVKSEEQLTL